MGTAAIQRHTYAEYLAIEQETGEKHEFDSGEVTAMGGGSPDHAFITANIAGALWAALKGTKCRPASPDLKIWIGVLDRAVYPDVSVICGPIERSPHDRNAVVNPSVVVEVLSPGTRGHDAVTKAPAYRALSSVLDVLLVDSEAIHVQHFRRGDDGIWTVTDHDRLDAVLALKVGDVRLPLAEVYADTEVSAAAQESTESRE